MKARAEQSLSETGVGLSVIWIQLYCSFEMRDRSQFGGLSTLEMHSLYAKEVFPVGINIGRTVRHLVGIDTGHGRLHGLSNFLCDLVLDAENVIGLAIEGLRPEV